MLYLIALLEGFTTLAVEIIAIRLATPIVGSSIVLTSVFLGIVLLALSAGYYVGGLIASKYSPRQLHKILIVYLLGSGLFYGLCSFAYEQSLLQFFLEMTNNYILTLFLVALLLFFLPVFIASQTIPLLTELIPEQSKGKAAGSMLFASTLGSFLGSVGTSIVLFDYFGVMKTAVLVSCLLLVCATLLLWQQRKQHAMMLLLFTILFGLIGLTKANAYLKNITGLLYHHDSAYQEILIRNHERTDGRMTRIFHTNRAFASGIYPDTKESPFDYLKETMRLTDMLQPKRVLVIGTAGFTYPQRLSTRQYVEQVDAVDIDPRVKTIAETYFLQEPLADHIRFLPYSARYAVRFLAQEKNSYDLILLDAYNGKSLPDELVTKEFFEDLKKIAGTTTGILANFIFDSNLDSDLTVNVLTTRRNVFGDIWVKNVTNNTEKTFDNFLASPVQATSDYTKFTNFGHLYTDDLRTTETDLVSMWRGRK